MKTYPIVCPSCQGSGIVRQPTLYSTSSALYMTCPACGGNKWVMCSETEAEKVMGGK